VLEITYIMMHDVMQPSACQFAFHWLWVALSVCSGPGQLDDSEMPSETPYDQRNAHSLSTVASGARAHRDSRKGPKPWIVLKLSVAIASAIIAYSAYVYIGRLCIPMIRREHSAFGSRTLGSEYQ
jgi:hypothetical protein